MQIKTAVVLVKGLEYGVVFAERDQIATDDLYDELALKAKHAIGEGVFGWRDIVFMSLDNDGTPRSTGSYDAVNFLADVDPELFPWQLLEIE